MNIIAFSGGCVSGKTTLMHSVRDNLNSLGKKCVLLNELMRESKIVSIDDIRKKPNDYLDLQDEIIREKIKQEMSLKHEIEKLKLKEFDESGVKSEYVILIDRAISDSIFYHLFYVDKGKLSTEAITKFEKLYKFADNYAHWAFNEIYTQTLFFEPLVSVKVLDKFRPENIDVLKYTEGRVIKMLTEHYCPADKLKYVDLNHFDSSVYVKQISSLNFKEWQEL